MLIPIDVACGVLAPVAVGGGAPGRAPRSRSPLRWRYPPGDIRNAEEEEVEGRRRRVAPALWRFQGLWTTRLGFDVKVDDSLVQKTIDGVNTDFGKLIVNSEGEVVFGEWAFSRGSSTRDALIFSSS